MPCMPGCCGGGPTRPRSQAACQHPGIDGSSHDPGQSRRTRRGDGPAGCGEERTGERIEACRGSMGVGEARESVGKAVPEPLRNVSEFRLSLRRVFQRSTRDNHRPKFET